MITAANEIHLCEVCGNEKLEPVLDLGLHPLCDDLVPLGESRTCTQYPIEILYCAKCGTAHQRFQVPKRELFPSTYHYRARFTADVLSGMAALANECAARVGKLENKLVLDVGCNDGSLLDCFRNNGARTVGIEPTGAYEDAQGKGHDILNGFFSVQTAGEILATHGSPDVITFTNVFAHIENLPELLEALKVLISPTTMLVIENHYLGSVLKRQQFDTFYHEHPRTYSLTSFQYIAKSLGLAITGVEFPARYGGNICVFLSDPAVPAKPLEPSVEKVLAREASFGEGLLGMQAQVDRWKQLTGERLKALVAKHGKLSGKAFPGRAAILVKLLGLDEQSIDAVYEKPGSMKIGHYLPGTRIPILSDDDFRALNPQPPALLNLAWHISAEINSYLRKQGYVGEIVDIVDPRDFTS